MTVYESLVLRALEIRNAILVGENTAERVGSLFRDILDYMKSYLEQMEKDWSDLDKKYLSKTDDDVAKGLIKFLKGVEFGKFAEGVSGGAVDEHGDAEFRNLKVRNKFGVKELTVGNYVEGVDGARIDEHGNAELGELITRALATLAQLRVKGDSEFDGNLSSRDFVSGFLSGRGWAIYKTLNENVAGVEEEKWNAEFDNISVRGTLRVFEMIISQLLGENDNRVFTGMMEVDHYDPESGKVYLDTQGGKLYNTFRQNDCIKVQQFSGMPSLENDYYVTKVYELIVTEAGCGSLDDGENRLDWVTFRSFTTSMENKTAIDLIKKGDTFVRVDNLTNASRKGIVQVMTVGDNTPYIDVIHGLKTDPDNSLKGRMGNLAGIYHHLFGWLTGFGEYLINLYAVGDFRLRNTGENLDAKIEALRGLLATNYAQTVYDITEEDNYLRNASFSEFDENGAFVGWMVEREEIGFYTVNGIPMYENTSLMVKVAQKVALEELDGKNALHIVNGKLTQANVDVKKPGKHKVYVEPTDDTTEEYTEEKDTLYLSLRIKVLKSGRLTVGFPSSESVVGSLPKVDMNLDKGTEWNTLLWSGTWDGVGDFVLQFTGEAYVSLLSLTDEPLTDFKKEYSTQIKQTAKNITLTARRVTANETSIAQLQITADGITADVTKLRQDMEGADEELSSRISQTAEAITAAVKRISDNEEAIAQLEITAEGIASSVTKLRQDMEGADEQLSSRITQTATDITAAVERIGTNESAIAQLQITADGISADVQSNYEDLDGRIKTNASNITQTAEAIRGEISQEVSTLNGTISSVKTTLELSIDGVEARVKSVEDLTADHTNQIGGLGDDIDELRDDFSDMGVDITGLEFDVTRVTERVGALEVSDTAIIGRVSSVETLTATHSTQISDINDDISDLGDDIDGLSDDLGTLSTSVTRVTERVGALEVSDTAIIGRVSSVETTTSNHTNQLTTVNNNLGDLDDRVSTVESSVSDLQVSNSSIIGRVTNVESKSSTNETNISNVVTRVGALEVTSDEIRTSVYRYGTTNLFDCANGVGWQTSAGVMITAYDESVQMVNERNCHSSGVKLSSGVTYVISYFGPSASIYYRFNGSKNSISGTSETRIGTAAVYGTERYRGYSRYYIVFTPNSTGWYFIQIYTAPFYRPQIERGSTPTDFNVPVGSVIVQTVNSIKMKADNIEFDFTKSTDFTANGQTVMNIDANGNLWIKGEYRGGAITDNVIVGTQGGKIEIYSDETVYGSLKSSGLRGKTSDGTIAMDLYLFDSSDGRQWPNLYMAGIMKYTNSGVTNTYYSFAHYYSSGFESFTKASLSSSLTNGSIRLRIAPQNKMDFYIDSNLWRTESEATNRGYIYVKDGYLRIKT